MMFITESREKINEKLARNCVLYTVEYYAVIKENV